MKKTITFLLFVVALSLTGCNNQIQPNIPTDTAQSEVSPDSVQTDSDGVTSDSLAAYNAYVDFLGDSCENMEELLGASPDKSVFFLKDLNGDNIPEMVIMTTSSYEQNISVLSYIDEKVITNTDISNITYIDTIAPNNLIGAYTLGLYGGYSYKYYEFTKEGNFTLLCSFIESMKDNPENEENPLIQQYFIGDREVSSDEYFNYVSETIGDDNPNTLKSNDGTTEIYNCTEKYFSKLRKGHLF